MKRTLALILSALMVFGMIPMSLITALAHGPGVAGNTTQNQSIDNALGQYIPETIVVDGNYTDTGWDKDEWNEVDTHNGTWSVEYPSRSEFSYKYQLKVDMQYLYGIILLDGDDAAEVTVWLSDGTMAGDSVSVDKIVFAVDKENQKVTPTINGGDPYELHEKAAAFSSEQWQMETWFANGGAGIEFRTLIDTGSNTANVENAVAVLSASNQFSHFVSVTVGNGSLYYPMINLEGDRYDNAVLPSETTWPEGALDISELEIDYTNTGDQGGDASKVLPNEITVDGEFDEIVWNKLTTFSVSQDTTYEYEDDKTKNPDGATPLDLLSVGYSTFSTETIPYHTHTGTYGTYACHVDTSGAEMDAVFSYDDQIRFKYELRTDGTNLYGGVVVFDKWNSEYVHNDDGMAKNYITRLDIAFYDESGNYIRNLTIRYETKSGYNMNLADAGSVASCTLDDVTDGWTSIDGSGAYGAAERSSVYLVNFEFAIPIASLRPTTDYSGDFKYVIKAYEHDYYGEDDNLGHEYTKYAKSDEQSIAQKTEITKGDDVDGVLSLGSWGALNAADGYIDGMGMGNSSSVIGGSKNSYTSPAYRSGTTFIYNIIADYDYIYGAALIVNDDWWSRGANLYAAEAFQLYINNGSSASWNDTYDTVISFYIKDDSASTVVSEIYNPVTHDGETSLSGSYSGGQFGIEAAMKLVGANEYTNMSSAMKTAASGGKVVMLEFKIPLEAVGADMYLGSNSAAFNYYAAVKQENNDGAQSGNGIGLVHPVPDCSAHGGVGGYPQLVFDTSHWNTYGDKTIWSNQLYENIIIDGMHVEKYWNEDDEFVSVDSSNGYWKTGFTGSGGLFYKYQLYTGRDNLYGNAILDGEAVPGSEFTLWINTDPSGSSATHKIVFGPDGDGNMLASAYRVVNGVWTEISITETVKYEDGGTYSTITDENGYYHVGSGPVHYEKVSTSVSKEVTYYSVNMNYIICEGFCVNGETYLEFAIDYALLADDFDAADNVYSPYDDTDFEIVVSTTHNGNTLFHPGDFADFETLWVTYFDDNAVKGSNGVIWTENNTHNGWSRYFYFVPTDIDNVYEVQSYYEAKGPDTDTDGDGVLDKYTITIPSNEYGKGFVYSTNAVIEYVTNYGTVNFESTVNAFKTPGTLVAFSGLDFTEEYITNKEYTTTPHINWYDLGYASNVKYHIYTIDDSNIDYAVRNVYLPENGGWDAQNAGMIEALEHFAPETIYIDGVLNDTGWTEEGWIEVNEGQSGSLQANDYKAFGSSGFNYRFQMRTDGEYIYVAAVMDVDSRGTTFVDSKTGQTMLSVPSFRLWIQSKDAKYDGAVSFTHLYDVSLGLDAATVANTDYASWSGWTSYAESAFKVTASDFDIHGQVSESATYYMENAIDNGSSAVQYSYNGDGIGTVVYNNMRLRFAEHITFKYPWGGLANQDSGTATTTPAYSSLVYKDSKLFGENEEIMENLNNGTSEWHANTETTGFSVANQHGVFTQGVYGKESIIEFRVSLSEFGCEDGDDFEYFVQGASSGSHYEHPYTLFYPPITGEPNASGYGYTSYHLPFWKWSSECSMKVDGVAMYYMSLRNNYAPVATLGAKINTDYDGNGSNAIRFGGLYTEEFIRKLKGEGITNNSADGYESAENGANSDGRTDYWDVKEAGIIFLDNYRLDMLYDAGKISSPDDLTLSTPLIGDAQADNIINHIEDTVMADYEKFAFYAVLNGLPDEPSMVQVGTNEETGEAIYEEIDWLNVNFSFRGYIDYYEADGSTDYYDVILQRSFTDVENVGGSDSSNMPGEKVEEVIDFNGTKIAYIPLDNRPVNVDREIYLAESAGFTLVMPPEAAYTTVLDYKYDDISSEEQSEIGDPVALYEWLQDVHNGVYGDIDYYVISLDSLFSGGLVGSRDYAYFDDRDDASTGESDNQLAFEYEVADFLINLSQEDKNNDGEKDNYVIYFDSLMRLASTSNFNGYDQAAYNAIRTYTMEDRVQLTGTALTVDNIIAGYEKDTSGNYILGSSIYNEDGTVKSGTLSYSGYSYNYSTDLLDRYFRSRERKLRIIDYILRGSVSDIDHLYIGVDDSNPSITIQTNEINYIKTNYAGEENPNVSFFAGIDELGHMGIATVVAECYGAVDAYVSYFGNGAKLPADDYDTGTLEQTINDHLTAMDVNIQAGYDSHALQVLVLTKNYTAENLAALIETMEGNLADNIPTCIIDASSPGSRYALSDAVIASNADIGKLLGFSNWNTVANATGISLANAIGRYSYLHGCTNITEESHEAFFEGLAYSLVKDNAYIGHYKSHYVGSDEDLETLESNAHIFYSYAEIALDKLNASPIMVGHEEAEDIGNIYVSNLSWPWMRKFEANFDVHLAGNENLALNAEYTVTGTHGDYVTDLNDGVAVDNWDWSTASKDWFGAIAATEENGVTSFTFDLGADAVDVGGVRMHITNANHSGIAKPASLKVYALDSNGDYVYVGEMSVNEIVDATYWTSVGFENVSTTSIRIDVARTNSFVMLNEIEIY